MNNKILIAYFSHSGNNYVNGDIVNLPVGNTEIAAKKLKDLTGGNLFKIDPVKKYAEDYHTCTEEAQKELRANTRPELANYIDSIDEYGTIVLGFPNWWGTMPMPVWTFLERSPAKQFCRFVPMKAAAWEKVKRTSKNSVPGRR